MFALATFPKDDSSTQDSSATGNGSITAHILPCRIHHDGPVEVSRRYWDPTVENGGDARKKTGTSLTAYFRGRKLKGRLVSIPDGYHGMLVASTDEILPSQTQFRPGTCEPEAQGPRQIQKQQREGGEEEEEEEEQEEQEEQESTKLLRPLHTFSQVVVWSHNLSNNDTPSSTSSSNGDGNGDDEDVYVKGIREWIRFAEAMHSAS